MRILIAVLTSLLLMACQSTQKSQSLTYNSPTASHSTRLFDARIRASILSIRLKVAAECVASANSGKVLSQETGETCVRNTLLRSFDTTGAIEPICSPEIGVDEFAKCVIVTGLVREVFFDYGEEPVVRKWYDLNEAGKQFSSIIMKRDGAQCLSANGQESEAGACMLKSVADHLRIHPDDEEKCGTIYDLHERASCLGQAAMAEYLEQIDNIF